MVRYIICVYHEWTSDKERDSLTVIIGWQAELLEADERAGRRYIQQIEELRDQLEREKENACSRERELSQQRYKDSVRQICRSLLSKLSTSRMLFDVM